MPSLRVVFSVRRLLVAITFLTVVPLCARGLGQGRGQGNAPPPTGRAAAPHDITGYWVALVTDDWRYRMLTPPKGNVDYLPVTQRRAGSPARGIPRRMTRPGSSVRRMEPAASCACRPGCISHGRTTTPFAWISTPVHKPVVSFSATISKSRVHTRRQPSRHGRDIQLRGGTSLAAGEDRLRRQERLVLVNCE